MLTFGVARLCAILLLIERRSWVVFESIDVSCGLLRRLIDGWVGSSLLALQACSDQLLCLLSSTDCPECFQAI